MPAMPLMPGVVMCEAAAQLCSYYARKHKLLECEMIGFGGLDGVRFREFIVPGNRLWIVARLDKVRARRLIVSSFQGFRDQELVVEGQIVGIPLPVEVLRGLQ
jgi:3-hydroxyacyl-[acyl-carrier-protein] dehydratase